MTAPTANCEASTDKVIGNNGLKYAKTGDVVIHCLTLLKIVS